MIDPEKFGIEVFGWSGSGEPKWDEDQTRVVWEGVKARTEKVRKDVALAKEKLKVLELMFSPVNEDRYSKEEFDRADDARVDFDLRIQNQSGLLEYNQEYFDKAQKSAESSKLDSIDRRNFRGRVWSQLDQMIDDRDDECFHRILENADWEYEPSVAPVKPRATRAKKSDFNSKGERIYKRVKGKGF